MKNILKLFFIYPQQAGMNILLVKTKPQGYISNLTGTRHLLEVVHTKYMTCKIIRSHGVHKTSSQLCNTKMQCKWHTTRTVFPQWHYHTVNLTVSGHRQLRVNFKKRYLFFPNGIVFRYFDYPVLSSNLLAAWNVMLAVETWLIEVLITKCLTAPLHGKLKVPAIFLHVTAETSIWSRNFSKTCMNYIKKIIHL